MPYVDINPMPKHPVFTPVQAIAYARSEVTNPDKDYTGMCLHFCAWTYGFTSSGVASAADFWRGTPASQKRSSDRKPPVGSLVCWTGGSKGFGHIAIVVGYNKGTPMIASNDIRRRGKIDIVPLGEIEAKWGQHYEGWTKPYFPFGPADDRKAPPVYKSNDQWGNVFISQLNEKAGRNASIRKLQYRLKLKVTGNWNVQTHDAVERWQERNGWETGEGHGIGPGQAYKLFGANYFIKAKP